MIEMFLVALVLTIIIETWVLIVLRELEFFDLQKIRLDRILFVWVFASFATLPYLWFVWSYFLWHNYVLYTLVWELLVVLLEAIIFYYVLDLKFTKAFLLSFIVNFVSWFVWILVF